MTTEITTEIIKRYRLGPGKDAPRPKPFTSAEICSRYRKANPDKVVDNIMVKRGKRTKPRRDPLTTALFGPPP
jgi:hypothetical protein